MFLWKLQKSNCVIENTWFFLLIKLWREDLLTLWVTVFGLWSYKQHEDLFFFLPWGPEPQNWLFTRDYLSVAPTGSQRLTKIFVSAHACTQVISARTPLSDDDSLQTGCPLTPRSLYGSLSGRSIFPDAKFVSISLTVCQTVRPLWSPSFSLPHDLTHKYLTVIPAFVYLNNKPVKYLLFPIWI